MHIICPRRLSVCALLPFFLFSGCAKPPPDSYSGSRETHSSAMVSIGNNSVGEPCTQQVGVETYIYCGTWQQPSARVRSGGTAAVTALPELVVSSPWRTALNVRFDCGQPSPTKILAGEPAVLMQCTRKIGGWPYVAFAAVVDNTAWFADGALPAFPVMERSVGILSGRIRETGGTAKSSGADALLAQRLAARAFTSGDIGAYEQLMAAGTRANLADSPVAAETAFRAALELQQKALGRDNPNTATTLILLALQLSNQNRMIEADALFRRATELTKSSADPAASSRLLHYLALHALNQGHLEEALTLLEQAEAGYTRLVPPDALQQRGAGEVSSQASLANVAIYVPDQALLTDPIVQASLLGVIETRRYRAIVLRLLGRTAESEVALASAESLADANGLAQPIVSSRLYRTRASLAAQSGRGDAALSNLVLSSAAFDRALPGSKSIVVTELLHAGQLVSAGQTEAALPICQTAVRQLRELHLGDQPDEIAPCLEAYASAAMRAGAQSQAVLADMFAAEQLAQSTTTSEEIAKASARLLESTRNANVADAIRKQQDAAEKLADLYRQRDELTQPGHGLPGGSEVTPEDLDKQIADAQSAVADTESALQQAAPNYGQLVQQVVPAADVFATLRPGEAFVSVFLSAKSGWTFLLRDGRITVMPVHGDAGTISRQVGTLRASIEPADRLPVFDIATSRALYDDTLGTVAPELAGATALVVAPSGPLLSLPFAVLLTGPTTQVELAGAPWLVRRMSIAHVPSPANFVALRKAGVSHAAGPWFGFGGFHPPTLMQARATFPAAACSDSAMRLASLPTLPAAQQELDSVRKILGGTPSDELLNAAFTADAVRRMNLRDYRILHFATHALLPAELRCEDEPTIVTSTPAGAHNASGALLTASDIIAKQLDADLVILSACNSGGPGREAGGESLSGLARAFFYAGARSLLVTHWSVNDQAAAFLVAQTLQAYRSGQPMAGALRGAELAMLDRAGRNGLPAELSHPFFWAPFAAIGEGTGGVVTAVAGSTRAGS